jgi:hypothetical protein
MARGLHESEPGGRVETRLLIPIAAVLAVITTFVGGDGPLDPSRLDLLLALGATLALSLCRSQPGKRHGR